MKRFTTLLAAMIISISMFAGRGPGRLTITNLDSPDIVVYVDGNKYHGIRNALLLSDMSFGYHSVKVFRVKKGWFNHDQLLFSSRVNLRPNYSMNVVINRSGDVRIAEQAFGRGREYGNNNRRDYGNNDGRGDHDRHYDKDNRYPSKSY